jgi:hypothetical protein
MRTRPGMNFVSGKLFCGSKITARMLLRSNDPTALQRGRGRGSLMFASRVVEPINLGNA